MWHWEVLFQTKDGNIHSLYGKQGYKEKRLAYDNLAAHEKDINEELQRQHCTVLLDEQVVFVTDI